MLRDRVLGSPWGCFGQAEGEGGPDEVKDQHPLLRTPAEEDPGGQAGPGSALVLRPAPRRPGQTESGPGFGAGQKKVRGMRTFGLRFWVMLMVGGAVVR